MWILRAIEPESGSDAQPVVFRVPAGAVKTIGRALGADLIVEAGLVSRVHCRLEAGEDSVNVTDLESTNGTYVNGQRVTIGTLVDGDRLRVGRIELRIERAQDAQLVIPPDAT